MDCVGVWLCVCVMCWRPCDFFMSFCVFLSFLSILSFCPSFFASFFCVFYLCVFCLSFRVFCLCVFSDLLFLEKSDGGLCFLKGSAEVDWDWDECTMRKRMLSELRRVKAYFFGSFFILERE